MQCIKYLFSISLHFLIYSIKWLSAAPVSAKMSCSFFALKNFTLLALELVKWWTRCRWRKDKKNKALLATHEQPLFPEWFEDHNEFRVFFKSHYLSKYHETIFTIFKTLQIGPIKVNQEFRSSILGFFFGSEPGNWKPEFSDP